MRGSGLLIAIVGMGVVAAGCGRADSAPESVAVASAPVEMAPAAPLATPSAAKMRAAAKSDDAPLAETPTTEQYVDHGVRPWVDPKEDALSTFSMSAGESSESLLLSRDLLTVVSWSAIAFCRFPSTAAYASLG